MTELAKSGDDREIATTGLFARIKTEPSADLLIQLESAVLAVSRYLALPPESRLAQRGPLTRRMSVRLTESDLALIDAFRGDRSRSEFIREGVRGYLSVLITADMLRLLLEARRQLIDALDAKLATQLAPRYADLVVQSQLRAVVVSDDTLELDVKEIVGQAARNGIDSLPVVKVLVLVLLLLVLSSLGAMESMLPAWAHQLVNDDVTNLALALAIVAAIRPPGDPPSDS